MKIIVVCLSLLLIVSVRSENNCPSSCSSHGECVGEGICLCDSSFTGSDCSERECTSTYCLNGGTCSENFNRLECRCPHTVYGPRCEYTGIIILTTGSLEPAETVPTGPPLNPRGVGISTSSLAVAWDQVRSSQRNGRIVLYQVQYSVMPTGSLVGSVNVTNQLTFLKNLSPGTQYSITVQAFTENGGGPKSEPILVSTIPGMPPSGSPLNLNVVDKNDSSITLEWDEVEVDKRNGEILSYELQYASQVSAVQGVVSTTSKSVTLTGLQENTSFDVSVRAHNKHGAGPYGNKIVATTDSFMQPPFATTNTLAAPQPPENITVTPLSSTELNVTWSEVSSSRASPVISYEVVLVQLNNIKNNQAKTSRTVLPGSSLSVLLDGLSKYTRYNVSVRALFGEVASMFSTAVEAQTEEDVPGPVNRLNATPSLTAVELTWTSPDEPNGIILSYEIAYQLDESAVTVTNTSNRHRTYRVGRLRPWTSMDVSVSAYTRLGRGASSTISNISTLPPPLPQNVTVRQVTPTSVQVSWLGSTLPELLMWVVYYHTRNSNISRALNISASINSVMIIGLTEGLEYMFDVLAVTVEDGEVVYGEKVRATIVENMETPVSGSNSELIVGVVLGLMLFFAVVLTIIFGIISIYKKNVSLVPKTSPTVVPSDQLSMTESMQYTGPVIRGFPSDTSVVAGDQVLFSVAVTGEPEPEISWYHNGTILGPENDIVVPPYNCLSIPCAELSHSGVYRMYARNSGGTARDEFRLKVRLTERDHRVLEDQLTMQSVPDLNSICTRLEL